MTGNELRDYALLMARVQSIMKSMQNRSMVASVWQFLVLDGLSRVYSSTPSAISKRADIGHVKCSQVLNDLIGDGYVTSETNSEDRRCLDIKITDSGRKWLETYRKTFGIVLEKEKRKLRLERG